ncbi:hypothetical protein DPMN_074463 [Dreissena polymorpha]|uniref:Uncharacterized protein n=1 Tax=Dreissena polymorpha TaxID=45954 RepID=A0A9D3YFE4_DREPO|nr:hypothetical protein DPMN_074463 [Dreissena polymorpha]
MGDRKNAPTAGIEPFALNPPGTLAAPWIPSKSFNIPPTPLTRNLGSAPADH